MADGPTAPVTDDATLLQRVRQGDQRAMAEVFDRYGRAVYSVAFRILKDTGHAEDVMQEIFFQIWRNSDSFVQGRGSLGAWLVVVARNRSIDLLRRRKPVDSMDDVILASPGNMASEVEHNSMMEKVRKVLRDLPAEQQRSMELAFFEGLSHSEIAEKNRRSPGHSKDPHSAGADYVTKGVAGMTGNEHNTQEELASYAMQNLPVEESASIRAHLQACAQCRTELAQVSGDLALLGLAVEQQPLPEGARERFLAEDCRFSAVKPQRSGRGHAD